MLCRVLEEGMSLLTGMQSERKTSFEASIAALDGVKKSCEKKFHEVYWRDVKSHWRRLYTDALILKASLSFEAFATGPSNQEGQRLSDSERDRSSCGVEEGDTIALNEAIRCLDLTLIVAGAPGYGRKELVHKLIDECQHRLRMMRSTEDQEDASRKSRKRIRLDSAEELTEQTANIGGTLSPSFAGPLRATKRIREMPSAPTLSKFEKELRERGPFVLRNYADDWPALQPYCGSTAGSSRWAEGQHLIVAAGGPGRVVPVEVGDQYDDPDWGQQILPWSEFLGKCRWRGVEETKPKTEDSRFKKLYLAQYSLFDQFPALERELIVPDYVFSAPSAPSYMPSYRPPVRAVVDVGDPDSTETQSTETRYEEYFVKSAWLGPAGVTSPAHTDPYYNCYVQVVGRKLVWIAPPEAGRGNAMYCHGARTPSPPPIDGDDEAAEDSEVALVGNGDSGECQSISPTPAYSSTEAEGIDVTAYMTNTSQVDVFGPRPTVEDPHRLFTDRVEPMAAWTILEPGDMLCMPPGWWHAMRTLTRVSHTVMKADHAGISRRYKEIELTTWSRI